MTTVNINNNWRVQIDCHNNHQLVRHQKGGEVIKQGKYKDQITKAKWLPLESYHKNMTSALRRIVQIELSEQGTIDLDSYIERLESLSRQYVVNN